LKLQRIIFHSSMAANNTLHFSAIPLSLTPPGNRQPIPPMRRVTLLDLDHLALLIQNGQEHSLCQQWLDKKEQQKLLELRYEKRHRQWLGGRICAKEAALQFLNNGLAASAELVAQHLQIGIAASGRPLLTPHDQSESHPSLPYISISHSGRYAMAAASSSPCGIDIQENHPTLLRVKDRFCTHAEETILTNSLETLHLPDHLTLLWAAKEAIKKAVTLDHMPGFLDLTLTQVHALTAMPDAEGWRFLLSRKSAAKSDEKQPQFTVTTCRYQGYGIGLCLLPDPADPGIHHA
jgi:phosphopantetheinyl transferase